LSRSAIVAAALAVTGGALLAWLASRTEADIAAHRERVVAEARQAAPTAASATALAALPAPVQRYFAFTFRGAPPPHASHVELAMEGRFRRPRSDILHTHARRADDCGPHPGAGVCRDHAAAA
jgi:hypothetical protein